METVFKKNKVFSSRSCQAGFSLIEVVIAALILSVGIMGIASLQIIGMKGTHQSFMKQQAMSVVNTMMERMRANQAGVIAGNYKLDSKAFDCSASPPNCSTANCTSAQIALMDQHNLVCGYKVGAGSSTGGVKITSSADISVLVNGSLNISCNPVGDCTSGDITINVGWTERELGQETATTDSLVLNTRIATP